MEEMRQNLVQRMAEYMHLPIDPDLLAAVEADKRAMTKYCKRAKKRRAWPERGPPIECTWMLLDQHAHPESPSQASERLEARAIAAAERRNDQYDLAKQSSLHRYKKWRHMMLRTGWITGAKMGRGNAPLDGGGLEPTVARPQTVGRQHNAGLGKAVPGGEGLPRKYK